MHGVSGNGKTARYSLSHALLLYLTFMSKIRERRDGNSLSVFRRASAFARVIRTSGVLAYLSKDALRLGRHDSQ